MTAIVVKESVAEVDPERCIGCGLCVTTCTTGAVSLFPREEAPEPPRTAAEMGLRIADEKGKTKELIEVMQR